MSTIQRRTAGVYLAWATLTAFALSCGGGSTPAAPTSQPPPSSAASPTVTAVTPALGPPAGGQGVTISGSGFAAGAMVTIGGSAAAGVAIVSPTSITATTPAHAAGAVDVVVANPDGQSGRLAGGFTYDVPVLAPPAVTAVSPASGPTGGGTMVTVSGTGFASGATVTVGGAAAGSVTVASASSITAAVPARSAGSVDLVVTNPDGQSGRLDGSYTYVGSAPPPSPSPSPAPVAPTVTGVAPASGSTAGGTTVTVTGTGFASGATVSFDGSAASSVAVASATSITASTPAHAAGAVDVVVTNAGGLAGRLTAGFTFVAPAPPPPPTPTVVVVTITPSGASPSDISITAGTRVRFVNNDFLPHTITSDPHPDHTACPPINSVGLLLPGQARETDALVTIRTCGYHDHNDPDDPRWTGTIRIR